MTKKQSVFVLVGFLFLGLLLSSIYSNQVIAEILGYQDALRWKMFSSGNVCYYYPFAWFKWYMDFGSVEGAAPIFEKNGFDVMYYSVMAAFLFGTAIGIRFRKKTQDSHGSAHFATKEEIYNFGHDDKGKSNDNDLLKGQGVFLGSLDDGTYLRDNAKTHTLLIAPTRSGKGVGHIVPTLLTWQGSTVVTDIKGENWELTSGYRKSILGNDVFKFKPKSPDSCHYNPLGEIRIGTTKEMGDLQLITKILVDPTGKGSEGANAHWIENAWQLLQGVALHLLYEKLYHNVDENGNRLPGRVANLSDVLDFLYDSPPDPNMLKQKHKVHLEEKRKEDAAEEEKLDALRTGATAAFSMGNFVDREIDAEFNKKEIDNAGKNDATEGNDEPPEEKLLDLDGNAVGEEDTEAGLAGLQKKLKAYITSYDTKEIEDDNGNKIERAVPFCHAPDDDPDMFTRLYPDKQSRQGLHPHVRQIFQAMIDKPDKEFGSILSTLDTALIIYRDPVLVNNISESDFVMKDLMDSDKPISLYLVFGPGEIDVVRPLCRVIVEMMWRLNVEEMKFSGGKMTEHRHRLLMLLDEFPALGKMGGIEQSEGFLAGYGIKLMIIAQDLNQINSLYGKDNYVISNCQVQIYHAPSDNNSAEYLSKKLGNKTIQQTSTSRKSVLLPFADGYNDSFMSRPLMYPDEVSTMSDKKLLLFCKGLSPIFCNKIRYYEDEVFAPRTKIKPPPMSDKIDNTKRKWDMEEYHLLKYSSLEDVELQADNKEEFYSWTDRNGDFEKLEPEDIEKLVAFSERECNEVFADDEVEEKSGSEEVVAESEQEKQEEYIAEISDNIDEPEECKNLSENMSVFGEMITEPSAGQAEKKQDSEGENLLAETKAYAESESGSEQETSEGVPEEMQEAQAEPVVEPESVSEQAVLEDTPEEMLEVQAELVVEPESDSELVFPKDAPEEMQEVQVEPIVESESSSEQVVTEEVPKEMQEVQAEPAVESESGFEQAVPEDVPKDISEVRETHVVEFGEQKEVLSEPNKESVKESFHKHLTEGADGDGNADFDGVLEDSPEPFVDLEAEADKEIFEDIREDVDQEEVIDEDVEVIKDNFACYLVESAKKKAEEQDNKEIEKAVSKGAE